MNIHLSSFFSKRVSNNKPQTVQNVNKTDDLPSLELVFDLVKERITAQLMQVDGLDNKANFIKGAATGLVSIAFVLQSVLLAAHPQSYCSTIIPIFIHTLPPLLKRAIPLLPLLITFLIVIYTSHKSYKIDNYHEVPANPRVLFNSYLEEELAATKIDILDRMVINYEKNKEKIDCKARWVNHALFWLEIEAVALVALLLYQSVC